MRISLPDRPDAHLALRIIRTLREAGHTALFAGGGVRDALLGRAPKDFDVATSARPDQVEALFPKTLDVGKSFGVIIVPEDGYEVEIATFRSDGGYVDGRHPESIRFSTPEEDASRRDFTINGLFASPDPDAPLSAEVLDYVGGLADLAAHRIRAIGNPAERFQEDALRMLRAIRFAGALDFELDPATLEAIRAAAPRIHLVSAERIGVELVRMFAESIHAGRTLDLLHDSGLLPLILPEVEAMRGVEQPPQFHPEGDVYTHTRLMLDDLPPPAERDPRLALAVLLHDVGKPPTAGHRTMPSGELRITFQSHAPVGAKLALDILRRLRRSNDFAEDVAKMVDRHMRIVETTNMRPATLRRFLASPTMDLEFELSRLDILHSCGGFDSWNFAHEAYLKICAEPALPPRWVTGDDLIALGMSPGTRMGGLLNDLFDLQLEGSVPTREALLEIARQRIASSQHESPQP